MTTHLTLHCRLSAKSWTKGEGGEGKERLPQDPVLQNDERDNLICRRQAAPSCKMASLDFEGALGGY